MVEVNTENTNGAVVDNNGQTPSNEQSKPAWQVKANELAKRIDGTLFVQLA